MKTEEVLWWDPVAVSTPLLTSAAVFSCLLSIPSQSKDAFECSWQDNKPLECMLVAY